MDFCTVQNKICWFWVLLKQYKGSVVRWSRWSSQTAAECNTENSCPQLDALWKKEEKVDFNHRRLLEETDTAKKKKRWHSGDVDFRTAPPAGFTNKVCVSCAHLFTITPVNVCTFAAAFCPDWHTIRHLFIPRLGNSRLQRADELQSSRWKLLWGVLEPF